MLPPGDRPPVIPPGEIRPLFDSYLESVRRSYAHDLKKRGGVWIGAEHEFLLATNPGQPASFNLQTIVDEYQRVYNKMVATPVVPPVIPPIVPPVVSPVVPLPGEIRPLPNPDHERIRRAYAHDLGKRGGAWIRAEHEFLLATNPGQPASFSVQAIYGEYQRIFNKMRGIPDVPPGVPPIVIQPVVPPGALVRVPWDEYKRLFPVLAAKIEKVYLKAGHPLPPYIEVPPEKMKLAR
ncbi:MAG: hypothetical protein DDT33_01556 [Firmicutes bacterium]|nr:hypothetical protein [Bacillota bacterium]